MTPRAGFLAAILADPADDVARLSYADWLREQPDGFDQLHGRFLAAGLTLHHMREPEEGNEGPFYDALREQAEAAPRVLSVQVAHLLGWAAGEWAWDNDASAPGRITAALLPGAVSGESRTARRARRRRPEPRPSVTWERGCVAAVRLSQEAWATRGAPLLQRCPLERVELVEVPGLVLTIERDAGYWRMSGELTLPKVVGGPLGGVIYPATVVRDAFPRSERPGTTRDGLLGDLWDITTTLLTVLRLDAGDRWTGPDELYELYFPPAV